MSQSLGILHYPGGDRAELLWDGIIDVVSAGDDYDLLFPVIRCVLLPRLKLSRLDRWLNKI